MKAIKDRNLNFGPRAPVPVDGGVARFGSITSDSLERYGAAVRDFFDWATRSEDMRQASESKIDQRMCKYFDNLMSDARHPAEGRYALWGFLTFFPRADIQKSARLVMSREAMKGWTRRFPGSSRHPWPLCIFFLFMVVFLKDGHIDAAVALAIQLDAYLRPSEICDLRWCSVVQPSSLSSKLARNKWAVVIGNSDLGETTKTGESDDTIILNSPGREWVGSVLEMWARRRTPNASPDDFVFPKLTLAKYEALFRKYSRSLLGKLGPVTPHVARHSAPSHDVLVGSRSLAMVQKRGRWAHPKSVKRYEKSGRLLLQAARLPVHLAKRASAAESSIFQSFQEALQ